MFIILSEAIIFLSLSANFDESLSDKIGYSLVVVQCEADFLFGRATIFFLSDQCFPTLEVCVGFQLAGEHEASLQWSVVHSVI